MTRLIPTDAIPVSVLRPQGASPGHAGASEAAAEVLVDADAPLAAVLADLGVPASSAINGDQPDGAATLRAAVSGVLLPGSTLGGPGGIHATTGGQGTDEGGAIEVAVVAGLASGATRRLGVGTHHLSCGRVLRTGPDCLEPMPWSDTAARVETVLTIDDPSGEVSVLAVSPPVAIEASSGVFRRPPRPPHPDAERPMTCPDIAPMPPPAPPLSWASLLAPIPIALAMAFFFRPLFALFGLMGPALVLGRWFEQRRRRRRQLADRAADVERARHEIDDLRTRYAEAIARERWVRFPHVAHLHARARARSVRVWERRAEAPDRLTVVVGVGGDTVQPVWDDSVPDDLHSVAMAPLHLRSVPHIVDLVGQGGLGVCGDLAAARSVVRSVVLQLASLRGPADLAIVPIGADVRQWDWVKWLPQLDCPLLADPSNADLWHQLRSQEAIVIVDDPHADVAAVVRAAVDADVEVVVLSAAATSAGLPAACTATLHVDANGWLDQPKARTQGDGPIAVGITTSTATAWSKSLARILDPEQRGGGLDVEVSSSTLISSLRIEGPDDVQRLRLSGELGGAPTLQHHTSQPDPPSLPFVLGTSASGRVEFDLAADGPHALVAGTTGSGKSELLRTLVLSMAALRAPENLAFVLIDFKGGGAFDGCVDLPHVAGLITDLDEGLIDRALAGLRAEIQTREERIRQGIALPALVVVIDEFAVLANDYPHVLEGLIDLAARGRGLRMHLILATQKPSGVVDHRIRANTNFRIALRVQHTHESVDVVGVPDAAMLDRRSPGRAIVRVGSDDPQSIQVCNTQPERAATSRVVGPFLLRRSEPEDEGRSSFVGEPPLDLLASWITAAGGTEAAPLWMPPLPERCSVVELRAGSADATVGHGYLIGLLDQPHSRTQTPFHWLPDRGALVLFSGDPKPVDNVIGCLLADVVAGLGPIGHAYLVSSAPSPASPSHPCVGAVISTSDQERLERLLTLLEGRWSGTSGPHVLVAIDDIGSMLASFDDLQRLEIVERLEALARTGVGAGIHLVIGARSVRDLPHRVAQHVPQRLLGQVADPTAHLLLGTSAPTGPATHVTDVDSGATVLVADRVGAEPVIANNRSVAARVERCPERLSMHALVSPVTAHRGLDIAVGVRYRDLAPAVIPIRWGRDVLVAGPRGSGRTTALHVIGEMVERAGVCVVTAGSGSWRWPTVGEQAVAALAESPTSEPTVLLVDDADRLSDELERALLGLVAVPDRQVTVVASSSIDGTRMARSVASAVRANGVGLLVGGSPLDGEVFRIRRPDVPGLSRVPGRATLVVGASAESVHLAMTCGTA